MSRAHRSLCFGFVALALGALAPAHASPARAADPPPLAERLAALKERIEKRRAELNIPGLALAVVADGKVVLAEGFGLRDVAKKLPVTPDTLFAIGSTTKAFTAALAALLEQDGRLDLDDPVTRHLPSFRLSDETAAKQATIRDLLCHRTGLDRTDFVWMSGKASPQQVLDAIATAEPRSEFRKAFHYNNVMFLAAGMATAAAAEQPWEDLLRARLLEPLGMARTCLTIEAMQQDDDAALGYSWREDEKDWQHVPMRAIRSVAPAGCINSSANEMTRWLRLLLGDGAFEGKELIHADQLEALWTPHIDVAGGVKYGLGWMLQKWRGHRVVEHGGNIDGFAAQVGLLPDDKVGYVLLANVAATPLQQESLGIVWETLLPEAAPAETGALTPKELARYEGKYRFAARDIDMTVLAKDERLCVDVPGQTVYELHWPTAERKWLFRLTDAIAVRFEEDAEQRVYGMTMFQSGLTMFMPKEGAEQPRDPNALPAADLAQYCGRYRFEPRKEDWTVLAKGGRLMLDVPQQLAFTLQWPDAEGRWVLVESAEMSLFFRRGPDGAVESLEWHQGPKPLLLKRSGAGAASAALPSVAELMRRRAEVGGGAKFDALGAIRMTGALRAAHQGLSGTVSVLMRGRDRSVSTIDFGLFGTIRSGFDGDTAWTHLSSAPIDIARGDKAKEAVRQGPAAMYADLRELFDEVEVQGVERLGDDDVAVVRATAKDGAATTQLVSLATGLPLKEDTSKRSEGGAQPTSTRYEDWREVEGVWMPYRAVFEDAAIGRIEMTFEELETGVALPDDAFAPPAEKD